MNRKYLFSTLALIVTGCLTLTSCYNNKADVTTPPESVSFMNQVVPIFTSSACGCHNNGSDEQKQFSNIMAMNNGGNVINYDAIYGDATSVAMQEWVSGKTGHPGGGNVELSSSDTATLGLWARQSFPDDQSTGSTGAATYSGSIASIISSTCSGGSCHGADGGGAAGPALNYASLTGSDKPDIENYIANGWQGHGGGVQSPTVTAAFKAWIAAGMPQ